MGAASGRPGIVTTPMPPEGPTSSLTASGPPAAATMGSRPAASSAAPATSAVLPGGSVPTASDRSPEDVRAYAV